MTSSKDLLKSIQKAARSCLYKLEKNKGDGIDLNTYAVSRSIAQHAIDSVQGLKNETMEDSDNSEIMQKFSEASNLASINRMFIDFFRVLGKIPIDKLFHSSRLPDSFAPTESDRSSLIQCLRKKLYDPILNRIDKLISETNSVTPPSPPLTN